VGDGRAAAFGSVCTRDGWVWTRSSPPTLTGLEAHGRPSSASPSTSWRVYCPISESTIRQSSISLLPDHSTYQQRCSLVASARLGGWLTRAVKSIDLDMWTPEQMEVRWIGMDAGTSNAEEDAPASQLLSITLKGDGQVPRRPSRICKSGLTVQTKRLPTGMPGSCGTWSSSLTTRRVQIVARMVMGRTSSPCRDMIMLYEI
jgi:hypothetical protein